VYNRGAKTGILLPTWSEAPYGRSAILRALAPERRKACDLTQELLAEKVNYSIETIKKIEAGKLRPGKQLVERLAECLELEMEERTAFLKAARAEPRPNSLALPIQPVERTGLGHNTGHGTESTRWLNFTFCG
jgi:transcriptional regulator with XRE-family HTH domain